jgi:phage terminase large subunit-like protein
MGLVELTPGNVVDHMYIREKINQMAGVYDLARVGYDPWNAIQLVTQLMDDGVPLSEFRQGFASMSAPTKHLEAIVLGGKIAHGGNPVMRWMVSNVMLKTDPAGNVKIDKSKSTEKVDGVVALVMALGEAMTGAGDDKFGGLIMLEW